MKTIDQLLIELEACIEAKVWAQRKTFEEIYTTCERGEWLNWLFSKTNPEDVQLMTLVKGHQVNAIRHLTKDVRVHKAIDTCIAFGEGRATSKELRISSKNAWEALNDAIGKSSATASRATAYAISAEKISITARTIDTAFWANARTAGVSVSDAKKESSKQTADIFRKYISIEKFKI